MKIFLIRAFFYILCLSVGIIIGFYILDTYFPNVIISAGGIPLLIALPLLAWADYYFPIFHDDK